MCSLGKKKVKKKFDFKEILKKLGYNAKVTFENRLCKYYHDRDGSIKKGEIKKPCGKVEAQKDYFFFYYLDEDNEYRQMVYVVYYYLCFYPKDVFIYEDVPVFPVVEPIFHDKHV